MTGAEAVATIEREAAEAGIEMDASVRDAVIKALDDLPASIPHYLAAARAEIDQHRA